MGWLVPIYVAETDEQAWAEYEKHLFYFANKLLKGLVVFPPGYTSARSIARIRQSLQKLHVDVTDPRADDRRGLRHRRQPGHGPRSTERLCRRGSASATCWACSNSARCRPT